MPALPAPALVLGQAPLALGVCVALLHRPAAVGQLDPPMPPRVRRQGPAIPFDLPAVARDGTLAEPPALWPGRHPRMARGARRPARGPGPPSGQQLLPPAAARVLAPGARLPVLLRLRMPHGLRGGPRRRPRRLGLAPPREAGGTATAARRSSGSRPPKGLLPPTTSATCRASRPARQAGVSPEPASVTTPANGTSHARAGSTRVSARVGLVCKVSVGGTWPLARRACSVAHTSGRESCAVSGQCLGALRVGSSATSGALTTPWHGAPWPSVPAYCRTTPTAPRPCWDSPVSSRLRMPWGGRCAARAVTRCRSRPCGSQVASVNRGCRRSVEGPATAAAMVSQFLRGRSVSKPVTERSTRSRLVERRNLSAKGAREVARAGNGSGLACGPTGVCITVDTVCVSITEE
jgi:hypothetical protein